MNKVNNLQYGGASIFIVIFFTILIGIIVMSFSRIVVQDQQQATNNDLVRSAYDSAEAGLEDGTRVVDRYNKGCIRSSSLSSAICGNYEAAFRKATQTDVSCTTQEIASVNSDISYSGGEVKVETNSNDSALDQAYTCLSVKIDTPNYMLEGKQDTSYLIPLKTVNAPGGVEVAVSQVEIDWHTSSNSGSFTFPTPSQLPAGSGWGGAPALIRAQVIPVSKANININDINSNSAVAFLYPINSTVVGDVNIADANIIPQGQKNDPTPRNANCQGNAWVSAQYYCRTNLINLPNNNDLNYDLYLRITPLYNNASFRVIAKDSAGNNLTFHNVQPEIDSTGRANNIFRRLKQRVQYETPSGEDLAKNGGFDFTDGFCKNFNITNSDSDYNDGCTPQN